MLRQQKKFFEKRIYEEEIVWRNKSKKKYTKTTKQYVQAKEKQIIIYLPETKK